MRRLRACVALLKACDLGSDGVTISGGVFTLDFNNNPISSTAIEGALNIKKATVTIDGTMYIYGGSFSGQKYDIAVDKFTSDPVIIMALAA